MAFTSHLAETLSNAEPEVAEGIIREEIEQSVDNKASLEPLHQALEQVYAASEHSNPLESTALTCIPPLLSTQALLDPASEKILSLIAEHASAREIILQLEATVETINNEEYMEDGDGMFDRFLLILRIYATTIPRVKPRRKPLSETLCPVLDRLARVFDLLESNSLVKGRDLLHQVCEVSARCGRRAALAEQASTFPSDAGTIKSASVEFLLKGLLGCSEYINPALGPSIFTKLYPQYSRRYASPEVDPQATKYVLLEVWGAYCISASPMTLVTLDLNASDLGLRLGKFILMTHLRLGVFTQFITNEELRTTSLNAPSNIERSLEKLELGDQLVVQVIQPGLEVNAAMDAIVPFLLASVPPRHPTPTGVHPPVSLSISDPFIAILIDLISPISTLQPSPIVRHIVFLTLSSLFVLFKDDAVRLASLLALIEQYHYPQLRSGAISILRDCTVMALSNASNGEASPSLFASPSLLESVSPVVLKAQPKELFELVGEASRASGSTEKRKDVDEFIHHSPGVITYMTESLNFFYAVLIADKSNRTEIRSSTKLKEIRRTFLEPIKRLLSLYEQYEGDHPHDERDGDLHAFIHQNALFSVEVSLDRVESQIASLNL